jgi:hypothetical protein
VLSTISSKRKSILVLSSNVSISLRVTFFASVIIGLTIKVCIYDESDRLTGATEEKTLYTEEDFRDFLTRRGWSGLQEVGGFRAIDSLDDLRPLCVYQRAGLLGE